MKPRLKPPRLPAIATTLSLALAASAALGLGCDDSNPAGLDPGKLKSLETPPGRPPPADSSDLALARALGLDGGLDDSLDPVDPPAPAGDLKAEIAHFTSVDACVVERARVDPLVGDALEAIGYDTFLRDACRVVDAAKANDPGRCAGIEASSLEARCRATVAQTGGRPDACPWESPSRPDRG
ncbi:MAG TPA: hypothetical protein VHV30_14315, partial [Polyangiaceae bacterium]|nr:hypothetical protein [Polyangiaceae bacterium]